MYTMLYYTSILSKHRLWNPHVHAYMRVHVLTKPQHPQPFPYFYTQFEQVGAKYCDSSPQAFYLFVYLSTFISPVAGRGWGG